ncbi:Predicted DNA-binding transcriptional regulator YafY, contains an HTH and WYL domains [Saccharopolyspora shandongensis]|uniref:Predicted DNA-binding transcriptional regulator YafY, contains an HTH and WYL domains n=1 Tax=Saccharopolyspora shandongensis TaxID=418495 RepID=A0A1H3DMD9_9PSEU|nr:WYL domain-containing protein [Saccharopolyspora shandongensis]SDX66819.1 Predicted DNA-binding transcriptional regulator YafY, contains an HTH and WYL domains [Saccharopolyspora shandongensis]
MRAGRLLSLLLLLQNRGRMTADELAAALEVSVRTVYRDVQALIAAGVPVYGEAGHAGGYALLDGYRTRLTGLTAAEAQALFLAGLPGPAAELGMGSVLAAAELKIEAALPVALQDQVRRIRECFHLDAPGWYRQADEVPHLPTVAAAVWERRAIRVRYRRWHTPQLVERRLEPYGIVLKAGRWYTVARAGDDLRTYRIGQILDLEPLDEVFDPPARFDLARHWQSHTARLQDRLWQGEAEIRISPVGITRLQDVAAQAVLDGVNQGKLEPGGWRRAVIPIESLAHAEAELLRLGPEVEVLAPSELRERIATSARTMATLYD